MRRGAARALATPNREEAERLNHSKLRLLGVALVCAKVAFLPVVFDYSLDVPFTVAKTLLSHSLAYALAGVMVGLVVRFGRRFVLWSPLHVPVVAFLIANVAAAVVAADSVLALFGAHQRMLGLGTIADWVVLYFAVVLLVRTRTEVVTVIASVVAASLIVLAYELVQVLGHDPLNWSTDVATRPISTIGQATSLAQYLTVIAVGAVGAGVLVKELPLGARVLLFALATLLVAGAGATGTRSALLGIAAGSALLVLVTWLRYPSRRSRWLGLAVAAAASVSLGALLLFSPLGARFTAAVSPQSADADENLLARLEPTTETRAALYEIAAAMVRERPILGFGPDNFAVGVPRFRTENEPFEVRQSLATSAHSWIAYAATSSGFVGLAAYVAIASMALGLALRGGFRPLALVAAAMLVAFLGTGLSTINEISTDWLFWTAAGTIAGSTARGDTPSSDTAKRKQRSRKYTHAHGRSGWDTRGVVAAMCVAIGLALCLTAISPWEAARANKSSREARLEGNADEAISRGLLATRLDPGRAEYWHGLGLAHISTGRWAEASAAFDRASRLAPYDIRNIGDNARAQVLLAGGSEGAARARAHELSDQAVRVDPNNPRAQLTKAVVMQVVGNFPEAVRSVERALALDPRSTNATLYVAAAQIYLDSARPADAVRIAREGLGVIPAAPASVPLRYELARALLTTGQPSEAIAELDAALSIQPSHAASQRLRAEIRANLAP
jgi:cytochrome c-type biogenesis protein CcmH/NrfG/O-antigen ligase